MSPIQAADLAHRLADAKVLDDIRKPALATTDEHGRTWYDTRPMLDPREVPDDVAEMARQAIDYALHRGLVIPHPTASYLLRITTTRTGV